ncbi:MAG: L-threonylcarbamoyladenylate synthase [Nitrososphaerales archaeon]
MRLGLIVKCDEEGLIKASEMVKKGKVVVYPTDTVYGLGCNPYDPSAIDRVFELKSRKCKPLPVLCSSMDVVRRLVKLDERGMRLASKFWPGPLTIIAKKRGEALPKILTCGSDKLGIRIPNHEGAKRLIELCGGRLVGTSANKSGLKSPKNPSEVLKRLGRGFDLMIDGGPATLGKESTVIDLTGENPLVIRKGALKASVLLEHIV